MSRNKQSSEKISFVRGDWIYLANVTSGQEIKLVEGQNPHLDPTGRRVVFLSVKEDEGIIHKLFPSAGRLRVLNLQSKEIRDFSALRDLRVRNPIWSNDGTRIAIAIGGTDRIGPYIGVLDPDTGTLQKKITRGWDALTQYEGLYLDSWAPDDQSILFHTLGALYEARLDGSVVQKIPVDELFKSGEISSATRFSYPSDKRSLLFDRTIDTGKPEQVVSVFDLETGNLRNVVPTGIDARSPRWLPGGNEILFSCVKRLKNGFRSSICKIAFDGTGLTTLVIDADDPSYSK
jgi:Tol biopolymer transport system component